ncbi:MAG: TrpR-like protein, YerC/YecD [Clostridium sp. SCN 57-10]|nr:MAG: TrpR-like protein, YerC/YecD [Clostridium sp. SCN 57-10]
MNRTVRDDHMDKLFEALIQLETVEECYALFEDLCTVSELLAMKQRFWVARLLQNGSIYSDIVEQTGASTATISRVNRCLNYGAGGYKTALAKLKE